MSETVYPKISIWSLVKESFSIFKNRPFFWIFLTLFQMIVIGLPSALELLIDPTTSFGALSVFSMNVIYLALQMLANMGFIYLSIKAIRGEAYSFNDFFARMNRARNYLISSLLFTFVVGLGFLLLVIPGIILSTMFIFCTWFVMDKEISGYDSLKKSRELVYGYKWHVLLLLLVIALINIIGLLCFVVGLLVAYPLAFLILSGYYNKLLSIKGNN